MDPDLISSTVSEQTWLDPIADSVQGSILVRIKAVGAAGQPIANAPATGSGLGHPLHAVLTDIPLGACDSSLRHSIYSRRAQDAKELGPGADCGGWRGAYIGAMGAAASSDLTDCVSSWRGKGS